MTVTYDYIMYGFAHNKPTDLKKLKDLRTCHHDLDLKTHGFLMSKKQFTCREVVIESVEWAAIKGTEYKSYILRSTGSFTRDMVRMIYFFPNKVRKAGINFLLKILTVNDPSAKATASMKLRDNGNDGEITVAVVNSTHHIKSELWSVFLLLMRNPMVTSCVFRELLENPSADDKRLAEVLINTLVDGAGLSYAVVAISALARNRVFAEGGEGGYNAKGLFETHKFLQLGYLRAYDDFGMGSIAMLLSAVLIEHIYIIGYEGINAALSKYTNGVIQSFIFAEAHPARALRRVKPCTVLPRAMKVAEEKYHMSAKRVFASRGYASLFCSVGSKFFTGE